MLGTVREQEREVAGHIAFTVTEPRHQPLKWCHPHSGWILFSYTFLETPSQTQPKRCFYNHPTPNQVNNEEQPFHTCVNKHGRGFPNRSRRESRELQIPWATELEPLGTEIFKLCSSKSSSNTPDYQPPGPKCVHCDVSWLTQHGRRIEGKSPWKLSHWFYFSITKLAPPPKWPGTQQK